MDAGETLIDSGWRYRGTFSLAYKPQRVVVHDHALMKGTLGIAHPF